MIPQSVAELSPGWLTEALARCGALGSGRVRSVEVERLGEGEGFMSDVYRLRLDVEAGDGDAPGSLIAKIPTRLAASRVEGEMLRIYERETCFYAELADRFPVRVPHFWLGSMDPKPGGPEADARIDRLVESLPLWLLRCLLLVARGLIRLFPRRHLLMLEDLAPAQVGDQVGGCSDAELELVISTLATQHAHFWRDPQLETLPWISPLDAAPRVLRLIHAQARPLFERDFASRLTPRVLRLGRWLDEHASEAMRRFVRSPATLLHGDYRLDNLFFTEEGGLVVSDWQVVCRGPGVYDLAYLLSGTLAPDVSPEKEHEWVSRYHEGLVAGGVADYDLEACRRDYDRALVLLLSRLISSIPRVDAVNERGGALQSVWVDRMVARIEALAPEALPHGVTGDSAPA
jgi:hypothetical protein